ncbi:MAG: hypothetical protein IJK64_09105 [Clostridia bacterium]|nr:hypothetical protein [Clostridia bacterium]
MKIRAKNEHKIFGEFDNPICIIFLKTPLTAEKPAPFFQHFTTERIAHNLGIASFPRENRRDFNGFAGSYPPFPHSFPRDRAEKQIILSVEYPFVFLTNPPQDRRRLLHNRRRAGYTSLDFAAAAAAF